MRISPEFGYEIRWLATAIEVELGKRFVLPWKMPEMPRKIRELIADLEKAGFVNRGGKGSHRNFEHPRVTNPVTVSGKLGSDALAYQEKKVKNAIRESKS